MERPYPTAEPGGEELPDSYGETRVVLLPVDPFLVHAYWEVAPKDLAKARRRLAAAGAAAQPVLRFYDVTGAAEDRNHAVHQFDIEIDLRARNWYVHLWSGGRSYCLDLGLRGPDGALVTLAQSSVARTPPAEPPPPPPARLEPPGAAAPPAPAPAVRAAPQAAHETFLDWPGVVEPAPAVRAAPQAAPPARPIPNVSAPVIKPPPAAEPVVATVAPAPTASASPPRRPPVDMASQVKQMLAEIYRSQLETRPLPPPGAAAPTVPVDLTARTEQQFSAGLPSSAAGPARGSHG